MWPPVPNKMLIEQKRGGRRNKGSNRRKRGGINTHQVLPRPLLSAESKSTISAFFCWEVVLSSSIGTGRNVAWFATGRRKSNLNFRISPHSQIRIGHVSFESTKPRKPSHFGGVITTTTWCVQQILYVSSCRGILIGPFVDTVLSFIRRSGRYDQDWTATNAFQTGDFAVVRKLLSLRCIPTCFCKLPTRSTEENPGLILFWLVLGGFFANQTGKTNQKQSTEDWNALIQAYWKRSSFFFLL